MLKGENAVMDKIKNLVFDVGDVLIDFRWRDMLLDYGLTEEQAWEINAYVFNDPEGLWDQFDLGNIGEEELICAYEKKHPEYAKVIRWFISHGQYMHVPRPRVWEKVHELKLKGYGIYLLSNYSEVLFKKHTGEATFWPDIDGAVVSYMVHLKKPDQAIYQALCDKYSLKKEECLFFDDRRENVEAAESFGMKAKIVLSQDGLIEDLKKLLE